MWSCLELVIHNVIVQNRRCSWLSLKVSRVVRITTRWGKDKLRSINKRNVQFLVDFCVTSFNPFWKLRLWDATCEFFWGEGGGLIFDPCSSYLGFLGSLGIFSGCDFFSHLIIHVSWNPEYPLGILKSLEVKMKPPFWIIWMLLEWKFNSYHLEEFSPHHIVKLKNVMEVLRKRVVWSTEVQTLKGKLRSKIPPDSYPSNNKQPYRMGKKLEASIEMKDKDPVGMSVFYLCLEQNQFCVSYVGNGTNSYKRY